MRVRPRLLTLVLALAVGAVGCSTRAHTAGPAATATGAAGAGSTGDEATGHGGAKSGGSGSSAAGSGAAETGAAASRAARSGPAESGAGLSRATQRLQRSVTAGDLAGVRRALADGAALEARDADGRTPLLLATRANRVEIAAALLAAGADPDARDLIHDSPFLYAGAEGLDDILALTLQHGADVTSTNRFGGTALIPASEHAHVSTVQMLIRAGTPVNHINDLGWTALHEAIVLGNGDDDHVTVVRLLLEAGADPAIPDGAGTLPRELAARAGFDAIVVEIDRHAGSVASR